MTLADEFRDDPQGRRFADVWRRYERFDFGSVCEFFEDSARQRRMVESEDHHDRPALAGVVKELESLRSVEQLFGTYGREAAGRFRQAVGVLVKIVMRRLGWVTTGRKGSLGTPPKSGKGKRSTGGRNKGGLATWFNRAARYSLL